MKIFLLYNVMKCSKYSKTNLYFPNNNYNIFI